MFFVFGDRYKSVAQHRLDFWSKQAAFHVNIATLDYEKAYKFRKELELAVGKFRKMCTFL